MYWTKEDSENVLVYNSIENAQHKAAFFEDKLHQPIGTMISIELRQAKRESDKDLAADAMLKVLENIHRITAPATAQLYLMRIVRSSVRLYLMRSNPANKYDTLNECGFIPIDWLVCMQAKDNHANELITIQKRKASIQPEIAFVQQQELTQQRKRIINELTSKQHENKSLFAFVEEIKDYLLLNDYEPSGCKKVVCKHLCIKESTFTEYCNRLKMKAKVFK